MAFVVGIVAEGKTDLPVLECLIVSAFEAAGRGAVEVRNLQPSYDATTGRWGEAGWSKVRAWCLRNEPTTRVGMYLRPLFAGDTVCDALLIHIDGDIADILVEEVGPAPSGQVSSAADRGDIVLRALDTWLWPKPEPRHRVLDELHVPLAAIRATETWIVAGAQPDLPEPEDIDPVPLLIGLSPGLAYPGTPGHLRKSLKRWRRLVQRYVHGNEASIIARCPHLHSALHALTVLAQP